MATSYKLTRLKAGRDYIADNFQTPLSLADMAQQAYLSPYHFLRVFKHTYGETPNEFLIRLRVEQAKKMLITENYSISEVCEHVGYTSLGSFSSLFLKQTGMAPTLYRRKLWALSAEPFCFPARAIPACYAFHFLGK
ncbi:MULTISPECIES: AraC family transcriptional regulator [Pseudoalteromonas]|uniref:AraC family transcriptional regulator n=2 Tax=Pseudoalteromonas TaxID=53246 RepID=A0A0F4QGV8_9GAMM|nr:MULTISPECIES: AraC family transcriptional regulator [Pseudoalteromonas]KJZ06544.1 regulatory protein pocR [Pseudoalteromonas rubra]QTL37514.1 helix-turn-helix transcriptional regulator [Pseudoalteromonas viridis]RZM85422.1 AraC family transcriptional regulator [Pseudoalteromonas rubra]